MDGYKLHRQFGYFQLQINGLFFSSIYFLILFFQLPLQFTKQERMKARMKVN